MTRPEFVVAVADLESGPKVVDFILSEPWLRAALEGTQAEPRGPGQLHAQLSRNGREVLVRADALVSVTLPCVVTLDPLPFEIRSEILLLLSPEATAVPPRRKPAQAAGAAAPGRKKKSRKAWADDPELSKTEAGRDTFSGDQVVLDAYVREFILLELPMYPRRSDLPSPGDAASPPAPEPAASAAIDPRLKPLADLAQRLAKKAKE